MRSFLTIALIAGALAGGAQAQVATAPTAPAPTAHQLELSHELIEASGASANYDKMMAGIMRQIFAQASQGLPEKSQQAMAAMEKAEESTMAQIKPKMFAAIEKAYATTYTETEIQDILAFDRSPAGKAVVAKSPLLTQNMMGDLGTLMPVIRTDMINSLCASMQCTAAQRQAMLDKMTTPKT